MKYFANLLFISVIFVLTACGSKVPIADSSQAFPEDRLVGKWTTAEKDPEESIDISVYKFKDKEYLAWAAEEKTDSLKTKIDYHFYRIYSIDIEGKRFINAQDIDSPKPENRVYFFYHYLFTSDSSLDFVELENADSTNIEKFERSEDLYDFLKRNVNNTELYGDTIRLIKTETF